MEEFYYTVQQEQEILENELSILEREVEYLEHEKIGIEKDINERKDLIERIRNLSINGGVIIIVDKICDHNGYFSTVLKRLTMHFKLLQGAKPEEVLTKEMSLAGIQIPICQTVLGNDAKLFFRMGEFAGWVIET